MDVKTVFLHGELDETRYMEQPNEFEVHKGKDIVCLLKRSLYSLKQSPRQWNKRFDNYVLKQFIEVILILACIIEVTNHLRMNTFYST